MITGRPTMIRALKNKLNAQTIRIPFPMTGCSVRMKRKLSERSCFTTANTLVPFFGFLNGIWINSSIVAENKKQTMLTYNIGQIP